ncbi:MAG TPA: DNA gyrase subunit A, partial [Candidatus Megaira endosymbiont of Hartmannula sinica]|nr:DNA gyrase subunit A [Candidatus Megaera endosymbiont of Hartmannula sinica]
MSTIISRSLPDVRDGLKPVHRRLLYAMLKLRLNPQALYKKSARIVGDVIGKYHPHGDVAVYESLVRMAQNFSLRYPLIDGQGNFGSIDGDKAAAMRYTESKLSLFGIMMMEDIEKDTVDFGDNYDGSENEPLVLPARLPNILINGSEGIAVGMATNIPPHNLNEVIDGLIFIIDLINDVSNSYKKESNLNNNYFLDYEDFLSSDLVYEKILNFLGKSDNINIKNSKENRLEIFIEAINSFIKGPDFPSKAIIVASKQDIREIYTRGKGSIILRARWNIEYLDKYGNIVENCLTNNNKHSKNKYRIIIDQIPYQTQKSKLLQQIADLIKNKNFADIIDDVMDESDKDIRIVVIPSKSFSLTPDKLIEFLFKKTSLETRFNVNLNVINHINKNNYKEGLSTSQGSKLSPVPSVMNIIEILISFLKHRREVLLRRVIFKLDNINNRIRFISALRAVYLDLDRVIAIIRYEDNPKELLMQEFSLDLRQAESILDLKLRFIQKLEEDKINQEYNELLSNKKHYQDKKNHST